MIFTFYSFKGGVGRSMALANIAEVFYARGLKVLMIDFDLEAPGLERYFDVTNSATSSVEVLARRGVIDLILSFLELQSLAPKLPPAAAPDAATQVSFPFSVEPLPNFILPIYDDPSRPGKLSLMPSGNRRKPDFAAYANRVLSFDWAKFYTEKDGERFFEWFRTELERDWDVVLIDSRTGVTELGGVCTHHLADAVISFVATNLQNLEGSAMMARSLDNKKLVAEGRKGRKLQQLFVPSRVELSEEDKHDEFADLFHREFRKYFPANQSPEQSWFLDLRLFYVPAYSYMERVAVREPERASKADLIQAYGRLAARMASMPEAGPLLDAWAPPSRTISNLPPRNLYFSGREEDVKRIRALLPTGTPVAICGLAGMGKTSLAIEYAYHYRSEYAAILFCPVGSENEMRQGCEELLRLLSVTIADTHPRDALRMWLEGNEGWLLILDDAIDPSVVRPILPQSLRGHALYTTRTQQVSALGAQPVAIESMSRESSIGFFERRLGKREFSDSERTAVGELVDEVGALPLALEQIAAYIVNRGTRIQDYLASYRRRRLGLLDQQVALSAGRELSFSAVLEPTLEEIDKIPASADVLRVASFLSAEPIPTILLVAGAKELGEPIASTLAIAVDDPLAVDQVLDPLTKFSLIERNRESQAFSVHKLVADLVRAKVQDAATWQRRITMALDASFPDPTWENTVICAALIPHIMTALAWSNKPMLRIRAARYLLIRGEYARTEECLRDPKTYGDGIGEVFARQLLARVYFAQSRFKDAVSLLERALAVTNELNLGDEMRTGLLLNLAESYAAVGDITQANQLYVTAFDEAQKRGDLQSMVVALCGRAGTLVAPDPEQAIAAATEAVSYAERAGLELQATAYGSLANVLIAAGRALEPHTMQVLRRALAVGEQVYGPEHPILAATLRMYAILLHVDGQETEAQAIYRRAQGIIDRALGAKSATSANFRNEYESLLASANSMLDQTNLPKAQDDSPNTKTPPEFPPPVTAMPTSSGEKGKPDDSAAPAVPSGLWSTLWGIQRGSRMRSLIVAILGAGVIMVAAIFFYVQYRKTSSPPSFVELNANSPDVRSGSTTTAVNGPAVNSPGLQNSPVPSEWGINISADVTLEPAYPGGPSAGWEPVRAWRSGYQTAVIFQHGRYYWTVIEEPDQQSSKAALKIIRSKPPYERWNEGTVIHISEWCPNATFVRVVQVAEVSTKVYNCPTGQAK